MEALALAGEPGLLMKTYNIEYKYTFKWIFNNFSALPNGTVERSSEFSVDPQSKWHMEFRKTEACYYLFVCRNAEANAILHCNVSISDCNNELLWNKEWKHNTSRRESKYQLLPVTKDMSKTESAPNDQKQLEKLSKDLKNMLDSNTDADVTLRVQGESIAVHKNILSARSSVFARMFQQGMAESENNVAHIEDVSMSTMKALVSFMYSGLLVDYDFDTALELYYAADKYAVMDLRDICSRNLVSKLTLPIVHKVLSLASMHGDLILRDKVMQYIAYHRQE